MVNLHKHVLLLIEKHNFTKKKFENWINITAIVSRRYCPWGGNTLVAKLTFDEAGCSSSVNNVIAGCTGVYKSKHVT